MARISSYPQDSSLSGEDRLLGSSYEGEGQNGAIYKTRTYKLAELGDFVSTYVGDVNLNDSEVFNSLSQTVTNNTNAISTANQSITTITNELLSQSTFQTNLAASFGTFDDDGNLVSFSEATANQILQVTTSDRYANAQFVTNLAASVGTYDANGNLVTMGQAFADQVLAVTVSDKYATSEFATNLASSFGTYDEDGNILTLSSGFVDQVISSTSTAIDSITEFQTNLASSFGTYDSSGNILTLSSSFADEVLSTANTAAFAEASKLTALGASFGTVNPDGSVSFNSNSTYSNSILNYVDSNSALATQVSNLETTITNIPQTIRQPEPPDVNAFPLGSIWVDTDDNNTLYILVDGTPRTWEPTTSEALGDLILSNAQLETEIELLSNTVSSQALKTQTLTAQFGVYDPATNTFTIDNNANVISSLRAYADSESAVATRVDTVESELGDLNTTVDTFSSSIDGIEGKWGVTIDNNGSVTGIELNSGASGYTTFTVNADKFTIKDPANPTSASPFTVTGGEVRLNVPLNGVSGTFTGTLQAGDVTISNNLIEIDSTSGVLRFVEGATTGGQVYSSGGVLVVDANTQATMQSPTSSISTNVMGVIIDTDAALSITSQNILGSADTLIQFACGGNTLQVSSAGVFVNSTQIGTGIQSETDPTVPSHVKSITTTNISNWNTAYGWGDHASAGYLTSVSGFAALTGATFTGNVFAPDFILSSDINLKENIKDYAVKPININYKSYNLIGDDQRRVGVIAQELEVEHPEFVRENEEGIKSVSYIDMLVAKVAELEARIKELEHGATK